MDFIVTFRISPQAVFGVPEEGKTVVPSSVGQIISDTYHSRTLTRVGHGTLSMYRDESARIDIRVHVGSSDIHLIDNYAFMNVSAESANEAYEQARTDLDTLLQRLMLKIGHSFSFKALLLESTDERIYPIPKRVRMSSVTTYDLANLRDAIDQAAEESSCTDQRLRRALAYYEHALLLYQVRELISEPFSRHFRNVVSAVFLNLWKSCTAILGDPSKSKDGYHTRYRELGLGEEFHDRLQILKRLRNDSDVAHYSLSDSELETVEKAVGHARSIAAQAIAAYVEHLRNKGA